MRVRTLFVSTVAAVMLVASPALAGFAEEVARQLRAQG